MGNIIPSFNDPAWRTYDTPDMKSASFSLSEDGSRATIRTLDTFGVGKWICTVPVKGGAFYDFSAACKTECEECDAYLIITQYTESGKMPIREHIKDTVRDGDFLRFSDKLDIAPETVRIEVELWIKGWGAYGEWECPIMTEGEPLPPRTVRVAPIHLKWNSELGKTEASQFEAYMKAVDMAGERGADLIVLGEAMYGRGLGLTHEVRTATVEKTIMKALVEKAKQYHTYIVYDGVERDGDYYYNTAVIIGRNGEEVGKYRKTHITVGEYETGIAPGTEFPVFDLDFGRVGILICYDQFFPETAKALAAKGAEIICIPTAGDDHHACMSLAMDCGVYLAVAGMNTENNFGWGPTRVVDPLGMLLAHTDVNMESAFAEIDLSKKTRRFWMSTGPALSSVHDDYRYEVNPHSFK